MIKITVPENNIHERKYILDIFFSEFLDIKYELILNDSANKIDYWVIELENKKKIIFEDHFFNNFCNELEYLSIENIPSKVKFFKNNFTIEETIPSIYGSSNFLETDCEIICGVDIFASSFFMLTRWEEYVNKERDSHNRFSASNSLALKHNFLYRPIVNEYLEMLKNMILKLNNSSVFKKRKFNFLLTHDIDYISKWDTPKKILKHLASDIIRRKSIKEFYNSIKKYLLLKLKHEKDPYDTYEYLMNISEKTGNKSYFFFMAEGLTNYDNNYNSSSDTVKNIVKKIKNRGHPIGIHPTYNAYNNKVQLAKEKKELENNFKSNISFGRQHFLRFEVPTTWQVWEDNRMKWDSTCGYADKEGFRCGVCYEYSVFNISTRQKLKLKEKPLIAMDSSFIAYQKDVSPLEIKYKIQKLINKVKKYNGDFVFLWHNSSFNIYEWRKVQNIYEKVVCENSKN